MVETQEKLKKSRHPISVPLEYYKCRECKHWRAVARIVLQAQGVVWVWALKSVC